MSGELFAKKLKEAIEANIANPSFGVEELAGKLDMSRSSLYRKTKSATGKSINQFIRETRLNKARDLLLDGSVTASEAAFQTGFSSLSYFTSSFRKHFGFTPGDRPTRKTQNTSVETQNFASLHGNSPQQYKTAKSRIILMGILSAIIAASAVLIFLFVSGRIVNDKSIAILPLRSNSQSSGDDKIAEIIREEIITTLSQIEVFDVRSAASSRKYIDTVGMSNHKISRKLKVKYLIEGSVSSTRDSVRLHIQMIRGKHDDHFGAVDYYIPNSGKGMITKMLSIAEHIAYHLNVVLKPYEKSTIQTRYTMKENSILNYRLGNSFLNFEKEINMKKAVSYFREAIKLDSSWSLPHYKLGFALSYIIQSEPTAENIKERMAATQSAHKLKPTFATLVELARAYYEEGNFKKSKKYFRKAERKSSDYNGLLFYWAKSLRSFGNLEKAEELLLKLTKKDPKNGQILYSLGITYEMLRQPINARESFKRGTYTNPDLQINHMGLADNILKWEGDIDGSREVIENAIKVIPLKGNNTLNVSYHSVILDIFDGKYEDALQELKSWSYPAMMEIERPPYYFRPRSLLLAEIYGCLGQKDLQNSYYDSTRIFIENKFEEFPLLQNRPGMLSCLGVAYAGLGDTDTALEMANQVRRLLAKTPDKFYGPFALEDVAWIYTKTGEYKKALKTIRKLLSRPGPLTVKLLELDPKWEPLRKLPEYQKLF